MNNAQSPPTALETKKCPPHHWYIDSNGVGECFKCGERYIQKRNLKSELYREKAADGGKKARRNKKA